jgi:hypothetical protein
MERPQYHSSFIRNVFFISGIVATFAYRVIVILNHYTKTGAIVSWYIGTIGFIIYFYHRFQISEKRARLIKERRLEEKVGNLQELNTDEKQVMKYIFQTLQSSKEKWNYICIFIFSAFALIIGIYLDFIQPFFEKRV